MDNMVLILIGSMNVLLVVVILVLAFFGYRLLKQQQQKQNPKDPAPAEPPAAVPQYHPEILERMKSIKKVKPKRQDLFCPNHPDEPGEATCGICDRLFCKACIRPFKSMHLCKEHLPLLMKNDWDEVMTLKTSTDDPEAGVKLYDVKKQIFQEDNIATYIETHYKINVDQDFVETYLVLFAMKSEVQELKEKLSQLKIEDNT